MPILASRERVKQILTEVKTEIHQIEMKVPKQKQTGYDVANLRPRILASLSNEEKKEI